MFFGYLGVLIAATGFITEIPKELEPILSPNAEVRGTFTQTKRTAEGAKYVMTGEYRIRPQVDFMWKTLEPFETEFFATKEEYRYSNEDEEVKKKLKDMPNAKLFDALRTGDTSVFFELFDTLYKVEENGVFHFLSKPKTRDLKRALSRVEGDGTSDNWILKIEFPNKTVFEIEFKNDER